MTAELEPNSKSTMSETTGIFNKQMLKQLKGKNVSKFLPCDSLAKHCAIKIYGVVDV
jgi:hypothetical protein